MKKWICMLLSIAMLLSFAACGENETDQPKDDATMQQSGSASNEEVTQQPDSTLKDESTQQPDSDAEEEKEPAKAELKYNTGYYSFEDLNDGFIDVRSLIFHDDGTVDYDWATYDYTTVGDYKLEYNGKPIYMVAGPSGDTFSYTVSDDKITVVDWNGQSTVFVITSDGMLRIEQTASESFTVGKEYVMM
jgi:hypothetical protein